MSLISAPAYVTDRLNRVRAVNRAYTELVGNPFSDRLQGGELFVTSLVLGRYRNVFPRRNLDVSAWVPSLEHEIKSERLRPGTRQLLEDALQLDEEAAKQVRATVEGHASRNWDGVMVFKGPDRRHRELRSTVLPLSNYGLDQPSLGYMNVWLEADRADESGQNARLSSLTSREREIGALLALGYSSRDVASICDVSLHTVHDHRDNIYRKLGISSRAELGALLLPADNRYT